MRTSYSELEPLKKCRYAKQCPDYLEGMLACATKDGFNEWCGRYKIFRYGPANVFALALADTKTYSPELVTSDSHLKGLKRTRFIK